MFSKAQEGCASRLVFGFCPPGGADKGAVGDPKKEKTAALGVSAMSGRVLARFREVLGGFTGVLESS